MHTTVATIVYDAVNPFELVVATEIFEFDRPELGSVLVLVSYRHAFHREKVGETASTARHR